MCGIAGFVDNRGANSAEHCAHTVAAMAAPLRHRGPDDTGVWTDPAAGVALAHRRLAILDLSPAGHQPMTSSCGRRVLSYNGEIYNHAELRDGLAASGRTFRGHSDTEVLVEACAAWGVEGLPPALKYSKQAGSKHLLRHLLYRHVPPELVDRPKKGFSSPLLVWLRGPMRDWADELLNEQRRHLRRVLPLSAAAPKPLCDSFQSMSNFRFLGGRWHLRLLAVALERPDIPAMA